MRQDRCRRLKLAGRKKCCGSTQQLRQRRSQSSRRTSGRMASTVTGEVSSGVPVTDLEPDAVRAERTLKLTLAYDGTNYFGWQVQPNGVTLQAVVERGLLDF